MGNLFINLEKYIGDEKTTRHEEFFTQLVAYILDSNPELKEEFIKSLLPKNDLTNKMDFKDAEIKPECPEAGIRFDIEILSKKKEFLIIVESKMGSKQSKRVKHSKLKQKIYTDEEIEGEGEQLERYAKWLIQPNNINHKFLFLISHPHINISKELLPLLKKVDFQQRSWCEFHFLLKKFYNNKINFENHYFEKKNGFLIKELIDYMEDENMKSWEPITEEDNRKLEEMSKTYNNFDLILRDISTIFEELLNKKPNNDGRATIGEDSKCPELGYEIKVKPKIEVNDAKIEYGFNGESKEFPFCFFIGVHWEKKSDKSNLSEEFKKSLEEIGFEPPPGVREDRVYMWDYKEFDKTFLTKGYQEQKEDLKGFTEEVIIKLEGLL